MSQTENTQTPVQTAETPNTPTVENRDSGSIRITDPNATQPPVGQRFQIIGESKVRTATYIMGSPTKGWFACTKAQGPLPVGTVTLCLLSD